MKSHWFFSSNNNNNENNSSMGIRQIFGYKIMPKVNWNKLQSSRHAGAQAHVVKNPSINNQKLLNGTL